MTTQTIQLDLYDYGASSGTITVRDPSNLSLIDTADSVTKNSNWSSRYDAVFARVSVLPAGVYPIGVSFNGIPFLMYVTLTGVDGEVAVARMEKAVELDSATRVKLHEEQPDYAPAVAGDEMNLTILAHDTIYTNVESLIETEAVKIDSIKSKTDNLPQYGDTQRHTQNSFNLSDKTVDVTITKVT